MTVSNLTSRTSAVGTGAAQTVTFAFPITANAEIVVYTRVTDPLVGAPSPLSEAEEAALLATDGDEATLAEGTHYSVTISGEAGGSITTLSPYVAASKTVYIVRATTQTQDLDLAQGGAFGPAAIEAALDRMAKSIIDIRGQLSRCLSLSVTDDADSGVMLPSAPQRANMSLGFGSDGGVSVVAGVVPTDVTVGAFGSDVVGASTAD